VGGVLWEFCSGAILLGISFMVSRPKAIPFTNPLDMDAGWWIHTFRIPFIWIRSRSYGAGGHFVGFSSPLFREFMAEEEGTAVSLPI